MKKIKSILVVFDSNDSENNALRQAVKLANKGNCEVAVAILMTSTKGKPVLVGVKSVNEVSKGSTEASVVPINNGPIETQIQTILERENIHKAIVNIAAERDCDLIVIGRRDRTRPERSFMESVTAKVIGCSPIDVLVMPKDTVVKWDNILLATDGSNCSEAATARALELSRNFRSNLKVVSIVNIPDEAYGEAPETVEKLIHRARAIVDSVKMRAGTLHIKVNTFIKEGDPHERIAKLANELNVDVVCVGSYGRTGLRRLIMGSVAEKVIRKSACPILVVKSC